MDSSLWDEEHHLLAFQQIAHGTESFKGTLANPAQAKFPNFSVKLFDSQHLGIILCVLWVL